ncbi:DUF502 domain-containing protein [Thiohalorhabdus sp.]|uniref:DUF502 domain-containing protein n=1 Tax=Thiohalorhabdus sp. TaxID=3094134 RepID=UPI002FC30D5F
MSRLAKTFLTGLLTLIPVLATVYLVYWVLVSLESALAEVVQMSPLATYYAPGIGLAAGIAIVLVVGVLMSNLLVRRLWGWLDGAIRRVPLVRSVYAAFYDLTRYFDSTGDTEQRQVVEVTLKGGARLVGLLTREGVPPALERPGEESVVIYLPMSYQIGGYSMVVPRERVRPVDMSFEEAMRFILTAGIGETEAPR